ncbi:hypothetical protein ACFLZG_03320, partial [Thermodesulfobacteriota bacterium]
SSGSRFSVWFCKECKARVMELNTRFQQAIVPIGRHSIMAGYTLSGADMKEDGKIEEFIENWTGLVNRMDILHSWRNYRMRENLKDAGFKEDTSLLKYLEAVSRFDKVHFFEELVEYFRNSKGN